MVYLEIAMILIGLGAVIFSVKMTDKAGEEDTEERNLGVEVADKVNMEQIQAKLEEEKRELQDYIDELAERSVQETEDHLSEISNDKMIGINEYSTQVIEKIEKNHEEVVFLYDMLREKQEEIKHLIQEADSMKAGLRDEISSMYQQNQDMIREVNDSIREEIVRWKQVRRREAEEREQRKIREELAQAIEPEEWNDEPEEKVAAEEETFETFEEQEEPAQEASETLNRNEEIMELYKKGHSVLEISKMLSMGQGEVKFVIDLYR